MDKNRENEICYIVGAGDFFADEIIPNSDDLVIAVDGGYNHLKERGVRIDLVIGDFDSMSFIPRHPNLIRLKKEKDDTDMAAAIKIAIDKGYGTAYLYGGTGGRFDHTLSNIQCLVYLSRHNVRGYLFGKDYVLTAVTNAALQFDKEARGFISVFSHTDKSVGVNLKGLKYELNDAVLTNGFPLGVSNEFIRQESSVSVKEGTLIVYHERRACP